jgi:hypothetical protein
MIVHVDIFFYNRLVSLRLRHDMVSGPSQFFFKRSMYLPPTTRSADADSTVFTLHRLITFLKLLIHPLLALKLPFSLPTDCVVAVYLHDNPSHHNTTDWEPFLCLIFQPYSHVPLCLFKEDVMITYKRNSHTRCSSGLNAFHYLVFISCCEMSPHFVNKLQKFSFPCPT